MYINKNSTALTNEHYIRKLISEGEHQQLDFKFEISDSRKIARTLIAFANTDGGRLLVGVKDNGAIAGIRSEEEYYMVEGASSLYCKPNVSFNVAKWNINGKIVLEVIIEKSMVPCYALSDENKWLAYIRVNDKNILANRILLEVWKRKNKPRGTFIEYSKSEKELLQYLSANTSITLSACCKVSKVTRKAAESILINLISLNIIDIHLSENGAVYSLK